MDPRRNRHTPRPSQSGPPVELRHVTIAVTETGALEVTVDGGVFPAPENGPESGAWTRGTFGALLDAVTEDRTVPVRIEVRESDGAVFTDIIHARRPTTTPTPAPDETEMPDVGPAKRARHGKNRPELVEVTAEGFVPGEDVAIAVIVSHTDATGTGHVRTLLDTGRLADVLADGIGEVVLLGRVSRTVQVRRLS